MSAFVFTLRPVLSYRQSRRNLCRQLLAQILADDARLVATGEQIAAERQLQLDQIRQMSAHGPVSIDGAAARRYHVGHLLARMRDVELKRQLVQEQLRMCREILTKADAEVKVLERLEEKQLAAFRYQAERREQREREEVWSARRVLEGAS